MDYEEFDAQFEAELQAMQDDGSIAEITEDGMIVFNFKILEILHPALYELVWEDVSQAIDESIRELMKDGLVEMSFQVKDDGGLEEVFMLTELGKRVVETKFDDS